MTEEQQAMDRPSPQEQVEDFEEEATAAKRSHGEPAQYVVDTEVQDGQ
ncbi:MAG: hypothetical protein JOZ41_00350 [Chloroflexi bacterium]|nr:hypothetical protein [Chloroflexota bacterium]